MLRDLNIPVLDCDRVVHDLYSADGAAGPLVEAAFPGVIDPVIGGISRPLLSKLVVEADCDAVAVVSAPVDIQRARVLARPGMTPEKLDNILQRQLPDIEKRKKADFVIDTGVSIEETREHVEALVKSFKGKKWQGISTLY
ncbi:hypothetical protein Ndes2437B_g02200 [Nannochloris sp. 'desiccata']